MHLTDTCRFLNCSIREGVGVEWFVMNSQGISVFLEGREGGEVRYECNGLLGAGIGVLWIHNTTVPALCCNMNSTVCMWLCCLLWGRGEVYTPPPTPPPPQLHPPIRFTKTGLDCFSILCFFSLVRTLCHVPFALLHSFLAPGNCLLQDRLLLLVNCKHAAH